MRLSACLSLIVDLSKCFMVYASRDCYYWRDSRADLYCFRGLARGFHSGVASNR